MDDTKPIELGIAKKLRKDERYRKSFFRAEAADSIALQIRDLRKKRDDLKQAELATRADMKQSAISRIEQAEYSSWTFNTLWRIAEALDARLVVTFEPIEDAIRKYDAGEALGRADAKDYVRVAANTVLGPITLTRGSNILEKLTRMRGWVTSSHSGPSSMSHHVDETSKELHKTNQKFVMRVLGEVSNG